MSVNFEDEVKIFIIEALGLEDVRPENITGDTHLFGEGLGLDSIDALELGMAIHKKYGIRIESGDKSIRQHFRTVTTLSKFIDANKK
ncbi:MAG: phosphopantetheine-binding protein [Nitrospirota bacterium]